MLEKLQAVDPESDTMDEHADGWDRLNSSADHPSGAAASKAGDQKIREENRKKTAELLKAAIGGSASARPRWRIKQDAANGLVAPFDSDEDDASCMKPLQIFRSAVWAVLMVVALQKLLLEQLTDQKAKSVQVESHCHDAYGALVAIACVLTCTSWSRTLKPCSMSTLRRQERGSPRW